MTVTSLALPELNALPTTEEEACGQLRRAFDLSRSGGHPLWHLIVVNWLFGDVQSFLAVYALMGSDTDVEVERDVSTSSPSGPEGRLFYWVKLQVRELGLEVAHLQ